MKRVAVFWRNNSNPSANANPLTANRHFLHYNDRKYLLDKNLIRTELPKAPNRPPIGMQPVNSPYAVDSFISIE